eukprot:TRINITY_DN5868_c0_g1_i3.p2 TRINITY_DN5868_c0_g1~~TRINITY_DN5868_c0_g1_i3.p2  ORF type:complete len:224 (-),score=45.50 TRINITY_DN5868_c0_g1_i3:303-917(-)
MALPTSFECELLLPEGQNYTVNVQSDWAVWKLREHVCQELGIPEHQQRYAQGSVHLQSDDLLSPSTPEPGETLQLTLIRSPLPACFTESQAEDVWRGFLAFSRDHGDTVDGAFASRLARGAGKHCLARQIDARDDVPEDFEFCELLWYFAGFMRNPSRRAEDAAFRRACLGGEDSEDVDEGESDASDSDGEGDASDVDDELRIQ